MSETNQTQEIPKLTKFSLNLLLFIFRVIITPVVFALLVLSYLGIIVIRTFLYLIHGGEFITYKDNETVAHIIKLLESQIPEEPKPDPLAIKPDSSDEQPVPLTTIHKDFIRRKYSESLSDYINGVYQHWRYKSKILKYVFQNSDTVMDVDSGFEYFIFYNFYEEIKNHHLNGNIERDTYISELLKNQNLINVYYDLSEEIQADYILRSFPNEKNSKNIDDSQKLEIDINTFTEQSLISANYFQMPVNDKERILKYVRSLSKVKQYEWLLSQNMLEPSSSEELKGFNYWFFIHNNHNIFTELSNSNLHIFLIFTLPQQQKFWSTVSNNVKYSYRVQEEKSLQNISKHISSITEEQFDKAMLQLNPEKVLSTNPSKTKEKAKKKLESNLKVQSTIQTLENQTNPNNPS